MKKTILGASILLSGTIIFLAIFLVGGLSIGYISTHPRFFMFAHFGHFWATLILYNLIPILIISVIMIIVGITTIMKKEE